MLQTNIKQISDGVFGVALGGNVPLRSIVSRGVRSLLSTKSLEKKKWTVSESKLVSPGEPTFPYRVTPGDGMKKQHLISSIVSGNESNMPLTGREFIMSLAVERGLRPDYLGIRRVNEDGFTLHQVHRGILTEDSIVIEQSDEERDDNAATTTVATTMNGADIDLFALDGPSCLHDLDLTLHRLKEQLVGEKLLGALMFSCGGRGPSKRSMMGKEMADASSFEETFPGLPCLGFYAGGEIGPMAKADNNNVFQQGQAALQGFTVVFGVFVVPIPTDTKHIRLDDSPENCLNHMRRKFMK